MSDKAPQIKGIGAVLTDDSGDVVAHAFDFDRSGYGGYKLWEAQRHRVKLAVTHEYLSRYTYGPVAAAIERYDAEKIVNKLRQTGKLKLKLIDIGHGVQEELDR